MKKQSRRVGETTEQKISARLSARGEGPQCLELQGGRRSPWTWGARSQMASLF